VGAPRAREREGGREGERERERERETACSIFYTHDTFKGYFAVFQGVFPGDTDELPRKKKKLAIHKKKRGKRSYFAAFQGVFPGDTKELVEALLALVWHVELRGRELDGFLRQYLYFCTSKASELSTLTALLAMAP
jgi:hypothetical protein